MNRQERVKLEKAVNEGRKAQKILDDECRRQEGKKNQKLIGTCWRFHNSYSLSEKWWLYIKITGVDEDGDMYGFSFEKTSNDIINIERRDYKTIGRLQGYLPIELEEFNQAWLELKTEINSLG